jgi:arylsulfatase
MSESQSNIILLTADALRADHLGCYGYHRNTSPVLDEFADESLRFENAYSASSHTREAVPALLTGEYPDVAIKSDYQLATSTIASTLSGSGYATAGFHSNPFVSRAYGFDDGFDTFDDDLHLGQHKLIALAQRALDKIRNRHYARAPEINNRSLEWIDSVASETPFFVWNHYMDTHGPYEPPAEYATLYTDTRIDAREAQSLYQRAIDDPDSITTDERQLLIDLYDAEIRYNDQYIGEFLDALRERDLLSDSYVIISADHGDAFGEHGYYEHPRYLHDEITHVPLLVRRPSGSTRTVETPVSTLDIATTIEDLLGHEQDFSLIEPPSEDTERRVFSQARGEDEHSHLRRYALRTREGSCFCKRNVKTGEVIHEAAVDSPLRDELDAHVKKRVNTTSGTSQTATDDTNDEVGEEIEQRLDALGYK